MKEIKIKKCKHQFCGKSHLSITKRDYRAKLQLFGLPEFSSTDKKELIKWLEIRIKEFKNEKDYKIFTKNPVFKLMK